MFQNNHGRLAQRNKINNNNNSNSNKNKEKAESRLHAFKGDVLKGKKYILRTLFVGKYLHLLRALLYTTAMYHKLFKCEIFKLGLGSLTLSHNLGS